jgi:hypothetical protein
MTVKNLLAMGSQAHKLGGRLKGIRDAIIAYRAGAATNAQITLLRQLGLIP